MPLFVLELRCKDSIKLDCLSAVIVLRMLTYVFNLETIEKFIRSKLRYSLVVLQEVFDFWNLVEVRILSNITEEWNVLVEGRLQFCISGRKFMEIRLIILRDYEEFLEELVQVDSFIAIPLLFQEVVGLLRL